MHKSVPIKCKHKARKHFYRPML